MSETNWPSDLILPQGLFEQLLALCPFFAGLIGWIKKGRERIRVGRATGRPRCIEGAGRAARDQIFGTGAGWAVRPADLSLRALSQGFSLTRGGVDRCSTGKIFMGWAFSLIPTKISFFSPSPLSLLVSSPKSGSLWMTCSR